VSGVVVNGKLYSVNVPFTVSGHSQDVVINLPASQSAQPGSSVVFGFFGVLIVIVVLIVAVIVYFKRVR
jgi:hypothetical protein